MHMLVHLLTNVMDFLRCLYSTERTEPGTAKGDMV